MDNTVPAEESINRSVMVETGINRSVMPACAGMTLRLTLSSANTIITKYTRTLFILLFIALLSSCAHIGRQDGPPHFYVDETKIPNAVPKAERLSKYGNMTSYRVFGRRYYTLKSSKNYDQIGVASWYGTKFHAKRTSSGEPYNMLAMTAAHKSLPLPTYVEVTNLKNKRKIIVKVNDRGPFSSNRIIDLSYVAAKKLRIIGHGTAYVRVKAINPYTFGSDFYLAERKIPRQRTYRDYLYFDKPTKKSYAKLNKQNQRVYLQVGVFKQKVHAEKLKRRLANLLATPVKISNSKAKRRYYSVHVGPIKDIATADKITNQLKQLGLKPTSFK